MGGAKRDMEEKEAAQGRRDQYLLNNGWNRCVECNELFTPLKVDKEAIICQDCWTEKMKED